MYNVDYKKIYSPLCTKNNDVATFLFKKKETSKKIVKGSTKVFLHQKIIMDTITIILWLINFYTQDVDGNDFLKFTLSKMNNND